LLKPLSGPLSDMKRLIQIRWWWRLLAALAVILLAGFAFNPLYHRHVNRSLMLATERGDSTSVLRRLAEGADVNLLVSDKLTKPTASIYLKTLLHGEDAYPRTPRTTLLMVAVVSGHDRIVRQLLDDGAMVDARDEYGFTALSMAISLKRPDMVQLLLDHHADPSAPNDLDMPPLNWALLLKQNECARMLLQAGADPNSEDKDGLPAVYLAVLDQNEDALRLLLEKGADANAGYKGWSVLRLAIEQDDATAVHLLLHFGAHPNSVITGNVTLLALAKSQHREDIAVLLRHAGAE